MSDTTMRDFVCAHLRKHNSDRVARAGREMPHLPASEPCATPTEPFDDSPTQDIARGTLTSQAKRGEKSMREAAARLFNAAGAALRQGNTERALELVEMSRLAMESCQEWEDEQCLTR